MPLSGLPVDQQIVRLNEKILAAHDIHLPRSAHILDFCCGNGRHVREYIDHGYENTYGYDMQNYVELSRAVDSDRFRFDESGAIQNIPYPNDYFEFVYSTSVFEHGQNQENAFREIYRVLKPGGWSLHNFPSKWRPIEPHIFIPFGAAFRARSWYSFWAHVGIRTAGQRGWALEQVIKSNFRYGQTGLKYLTGREISLMLRSIFDTMRMVERDFIKHSPGLSGKLYPLVRAVPALTAIFRFMHTRVILVGKAEA